LTDTEAKTDLPPDLQPWEGSSSAVEQGKHWSSTLIWISAAIFGSAVVWGFTAKVDQTISVRGKLEPSGSVREVDAPSTGVVSQVLVKEGDRVKAGQPLIEVEAEGVRSRREAVLTTIALLEAQNTVLRDLLSSDGSAASLNTPVVLPPNLDPALQAKVLAALQQTEQIKARLKQIDVKLASKQKTLALSQRIERDLRPLYANGGFSRVQYLEQLNRIQEQTSELASLREDRESVLGSAAGQLNQNNRELATLKAELSQLRETLSHRTIKAPISGTVFNLKATRASVVGTDQVLLKLVPSNALQAKVEISNSDIGFIRTGLPVTVGVDSFPAGEFGYIQGTLTSLGSDALPPDQDNRMARFPAVVELKQQQVEAGGRRLNLQSGMSVSANIKLRSRPVITLISDMFTKQLDGVKRFR
jgi:HlyD family secretion protein